MSFFERIKLSYTDADIQAKARQDGLSNLPNAEAEGYALFEEELMNAHEQCASQVVEGCRKQLEIIDGAIEMERSASEGYEAEFQQIEDDYKAESVRLNNNSNLAHAMEDFEEANRAFKVMYSRLNRMPIVYIPHWLYVTLAVFIGLGEVPLNALVFNMFGENQIMTWVMSLIIGLTIPLSAHFVGLKIREHGEGFSFSNALKALLVFAVIAVALYALAIMRQGYLGDVGKDIGLSGKLVESSILFYWLNLAVFITAILVAYLAHDSVAGYAKAFADKEKAQENLKIAQDAQGQAIQAVEKRKAQRIRDAKDKKNAAEKQIRKLEGEYDSILKAGQEEEARWLYRLGSCIACYRRENMLTRNGSSRTPKCFEIKVEFPLKLPEIPDKTTNEPKH